MLTTYIILIAVFIVSYLIGSINSAIIAGKLKSGDDIRSHGSGNAGATNALRTYGKGTAVLVVLGDCLKAAICCIIAIFAARYTPLGTQNTELAIYSAGIGVAIGHNFPIYFGFKGGKGVLVSVTALFFADWKIALVVTVISILIIALTKKVSLGSIMGAVMFMAAALIFKLDNLPYIIFTFFLTLLSIIRHRENIKRLINGTESNITDNKNERQ